MTNTKSYPYVTHLDIKFPSLDLIDVEALAKSVTDQWYNQTLCKVNDSTKPCLGQAERDCRTDQAQPLNFQV